MTTQLLQPYPYVEFTEDDPEMADYNPQHQLAIKLEDWLKFIYEPQGWFVTGNVFLRHENYPRIAPDVFMCFVQLTTEEKRNVKSWDMREPNRPAPLLVFEVASGETFSKDLGEKIDRYRQMGVQDYFVYDPTLPFPVWPEKNIRLRGWRFVNGISQSPNTHPSRAGWLWSEVLQLWLVPAEDDLELRDTKGNLVANREIARQAAVQEAEKQRLRAEMEAQEAEKQRLRAETEAQEAEKQRLRAEQLEKDRLTEQQRLVALEKEREIERIQLAQLEKDKEQREAALRRKLIEQGLNPDDFL
jgi:Uma2 family endonuclease